MGSLWTTSALGLALVLSAGPAAASQHYPDKIREVLHLTCADTNFPDCTICHTDDNGGTGTVIQPFGRNMRMMFDLQGNENDGLLASALSASEAAGFDSDGDGDGDIVALRVCRDPNVPYVPESADAGDAGHVARAPLPPADPIPQYGCTTGPASDREASAAALAVGAVLVLSRRRSRRGTPQAR